VIRFFPYFITTGLPVGITGLLIASVFAAGMSTVATSLNSTATIVLNDYYKRYFNKNAGEKSSMSVLYIASFVTGALGILIALALVGVKAPSMHGGRWLQSSAEVCLDSSCLVIFRKKQSKLMQLSE